MRWMIRVIEQAMKILLPGGEVLAMMFAHSLDGHTRPQAGPVSTAVLAKDLLMYAIALGKLSGAPVKAAARRY